VLGLVALAAAGARAWPFAAYVAIAAVLPARASTRQLGYARGLAYGAFGWHLLGLAPALSGLTLEGPYGGPPFLFALGLVANVARLMALRAPALDVWAQAGTQSSLEGRLSKP
jgi:hypothetical protein